MTGEIAAATVGACASSSAPPPAAMAGAGDDRLAGVTLFCAQADLTEAGELQLLINEDQLAFPEDVMRVQGTLDSRQLAGAFQLLRSNDLIWPRAIKSYLLGEREHPNDLMAWNADSTRVPARMHAEYLRRLFLDNDLAEGRLPANGRPVSLGDIRVPFFVVGTETDHMLHLLNEGDVTFVLASGGHNAGVVREPGHPHRHFRIGRRQPGMRYADPDEWAATTERREGSWWPAWSEWLDAHSGERVDSPRMRAERFPPVGDAPGEYVHQH